MKMEYTKFELPKRHITVRVNERNLWHHFHEHHYMTAQMEASKGLPRGAVFFTFYITEGNKEKLFGCVGVLTQKVKTGTHRRLSRLVILPEFQGRGLAKGVVDTISQYYWDNGMIMYSTTYHPRLGYHREHSPLWRANKNNQKQFKKTLSVKIDKIKEENENAVIFMPALRDGESMFRYQFCSGEEGVKPSYVLLYDHVRFMTEKRAKSKKVFVGRNLPKLTPKQAQAAGIEGQAPTSKKKKKIPLPSKPVFEDLDIWAATEELAETKKIIKSLTSTRTKRVKKVKLPSQQPQLKDTNG